MVAMAALSVAQVTSVVTSSICPVSYVPVAVSGTVAPFGTDGAAGVMAMLTSLAATTVTVALPVMPLSEAVIVAMPGATAVTTPSLPAA